MFLSSRVFFVLTCPTSSDPSLQKICLLHCIGLLDRLSLYVSMSLSRAFLSHCIPFLLKVFFHRLVSLGPLPGHMTHWTGDLSCPMTGTDVTGRDGKTFQRASNAGVNFFLARVKWVPNFTLFCCKSELCCDFALFLVILKGFYLVNF